MTKSYLKKLIMECLNETNGEKHINRYDFTPEHAVNATKIFLTKYYPEEKTNKSRSTFGFPNKKFVEIAVRFYQQKNRNVRTKEAEAAIKSYLFANAGINSYM